MDRILLLIIQFAVGSNCIDNNSDAKELNRDSFLGEVHIYMSVIYRYLLFMTKLTLMDPTNKKE